MKRHSPAGTTFFIEQLAGAAEIPQNVNAQNYSEAPDTCWTREATDTNDHNQSEGWADAQSQLQSHSRRNPRQETIRATGY